MEHININTSSAAHPKAASPRWLQRPQGSTWGDFGPDDQLGRLNLLTAEKVREGIAEVLEGTRFCLSLPLDCPGGNSLNKRRLPPVVRPNLRNGRPNFNYLIARDEPGFIDVLSDDLVILHLQYSTQWDSLAHVGQLFDVMGNGKPQPVYYNGYRAGQHVVGPDSADDAGPAWPASGRSSSCATALGVERMAAHAIQGRGVMLDLLKHLGPTRTVVGFETIQRVMDIDRVVVETGDMVCLRTGFSDALLDAYQRPGTPPPGDGHATLDGRDQQLLNWIAESGLAALIADNYAVENLPVARQGDTGCAALPLHAHCLFRLGVPLGELWHLGPLADWLGAHNRSRFLLTAPPLRLSGAVGSPTTPVATV